MGAVKGRELPNHRNHTPVRHAQAKGPGMTQLYELAWF
jgi:hypothetical protein